MCPPSEGAPAGAPLQEIISGIRYILANPTTPGGSLAPSFFKGWPYLDRKVSS